MYLGSDAWRWRRFTQNRIAYLEDGDWAVLRARRDDLHDAASRSNREIKETALSGALVGKGNYRHFMAKEIHEQPAVIGDTLQRLISNGPLTRRASICRASLRSRQARAAHHHRLRHRLLCRLVGKYWFEKLARLPVEIDVASEFRYRDPVAPKGGARCSSRSRARPPTRWRRCAMPRRRARPRSRSSTCRKAPSRAKPTSCCRPCRAGDRRRLDQGLHLPARGAGLPAIAAARARGASTARRRGSLVHARCSKCPRHIARP
jgi:hypothetical protein